MHVPFLDLQQINARHATPFAGALARVLRAGWFLRAAETAAFEREFAHWSGAAHCVGVANGYDALRLVLKAWVILGRLQAGDEVLVPANSFVASALAVGDAGLALRLADVDPITRNMTAATVEAALTPRTRAVMPVHLYGRLADVEGIRALCDRRNLLMLEDAAQAHGAAFGSRRAGTFGDAAGFSFYPAKNLGALGDAGCVLTADPAVADCVRTLGNYGSAAKYDHVLRGANSRIDEIQAAVLRVKLPLLDQDNEVRRAIAARFCAGISHPLVQPPDPAASDASHVWHLFVVTTPRRAEFEKHLASRSVETMIHYPRAIHAQGAFSNLAASTDAPTASRLQHEILSLPISPVMTDAQVDHVIASINSWPMERPHG